MSGSSNYTKTISSAHAKNKLIESLTCPDLQNCNQSCLLKLEKNIIADLAVFEKNPSLIIKSDLVFESAIKQGQNYEEAVSSQAFFVDEFDAS